MEPNSTLDRSSSPAGSGPAVAARMAESQEQAVQNSSNWNPPRSVSAALAAARAGGNASGVRFPGEDGGRSLAEMAQRDLDAALQLLADRAQYITGASGAAIALRRDGKNDMLCRASTGPNAPELGALLSTEFGLSGESVRTRQALRCDDAERDARVNRDVCRQMGIASVVVMPVVNDDEVLGVFELFSGKANAFGARDVSAVQRLSQMVETAVRLAQATESLPERLKMQQTSAPEVKEAAVLDDQELTGEVLEDVVLEEPVLDVPVPEVQTARAENPVEAPKAERLVQALAAEKNATEASATPAKVPMEPVQAVAAPEAIQSKPAVAPPKKPLFWSAALNPAADAAKPVEDQSHVPPVLRSLKKCEACGFPVTAGRTLCVECEEKKWRGQLKRPATPLPSVPQPVVAPAPTSVTSVAPKPEARAFAAAAPSVGVGSVMPSVPVAVGSSLSSAEKEKKESKDAPVVAASSSVVELETPSPAAEASSPEFVLSAGLEPSQSWVARNKYVVGVIVAIGVAVAAFFILR